MAAESFDSSRGTGLLMDNGIIRARLVCPGSQDYSEVSSGVSGQPKVGQVVPEWHTRQRADGGHYATESLARRYPP